MTITIKIATDNAAFENKDFEIDRIIRRWVDDFGQTLSGMRGCVMNLRDSNGNTVGSVTVRGK